MTLGVPAWITDNPTELRPTEILVSLVMKAGPVWDHSAKTGGWYAALEACGATLWDCDHTHPTIDEAWKCANETAMHVAHEVTGAD